MEDARLPGSAVSLPTARLLWGVQPLGCVTMVVPLATTPVRNISCLAGSRSIAIGPFPPNTSVKIVSLQPSLRRTILNVNKTLMRQCLLHVPQLHLLSTNKDSLASLHHA